MKNEINDITEKLYSDKKEYFFLSLIEQNPEEEKIEIKEREKKFIDILNYYETKKCLNCPFRTICNNSED